MLCRQVGIEPSVRPSGILRTQDHRSRQKQPIAPITTPVLRRLGARVVLRCIQQSHRSLLISSLAYIRRSLAPECSRPEPPQSGSASQSFWPESFRSTLRRYAARTRGPPHLDEFRSRLPPALGRRAGMGPPTPLLRAHHLASCAAPRDGSLGEREALFSPAPRGIHHRRASMDDGEDARRPRPDRLARQHSLLHRGQNPQPPRCLRRRARRRRRQAAYTTAAGAGLSESHSGSCARGRDALRRRLGVSGVFRESGQAAPEFVVNRGAFGWA